LACKLADGETNRNIAGLENRQTDTGRWTQRQRDRWTDSLYVD